MALTTSDILEAYEMPQAEFYCSRSEEDDVMTVEAKDLPALLAEKSARQMQWAARGAMCCEASGTYMVLDM
jgi:hypothetical protein